MKGQLSPEMMVPIGTVVAILFLALVLPPIFNAINIATGCVEAKRQLNVCQNELQSCKDDLEHSEGTVSELGDTLTACISDLEAANKSLSTCYQTLTTCKINLANNLSEIDRLSGCCDNLDKCNMDLDKCKADNLITIYNIEFFSILFSNFRVSLTIFMVVLSIPISLSLIDFTLVSIGIELSEDVQKIITFLKVVSTMISIAFIVSFLFSVPIVMISLIAIGIGAIISLLLISKENY